MICGAGNSSESVGCQETSFRKGSNCRNRLELRSMCETRQSVQACTFVSSAARLGLSVRQQGYRETARSSHGFPAAEQNLSILRHRETHPRPDPQIRTLREPTEILSGHGTSNEYAASACSANWPSISQSRTHKGRRTLHHVQGGAAVLSGREGALTTRAAGAISYGRCNLRYKTAVRTAHHLDGTFYVDRRDRWSTHADRPGVG